MHWCRHRVRFNEVPEKVPNVPDKFWDLEVQQGSGNPEKVPESPGAKKVWEALVQSQVKFNRVPLNVPVKV